MIRRGSTVELPDNYCNRNRHLVSPAEQQDVKPLDTQHTKPGSTQEGTAMHYKCADCGKSFASKQALTGHMRVHSKED